MGVKSYVSIPLWFLRNKYLSAISEALETRFHTTMVLTQPGAKFKNHRDPVLFPYHYGSYATLGRRYRSSKNRLVSIPLWFSRNNMQTIACRLIISVSIPLWFIQEQSSVDRPRAWTRPSWRAVLRSDASRPGSSFLAQDTVMLNFF